MNSTTSPDIHSGDQQSTKQLDPILHEENTEGAKLKVRKKPEKKSYILELPLRKKNKIIISIKDEDESNSLKTDILTIQSDLIDKAKLITNEKDIKPFWNQHCQTISTKLL